MIGPIAAKPKPSPPPTIKGLPIVGNAIPLLWDPLSFLIESNYRYGPVFRIKTGNQYLTVLASVETNRFMSEEGRDCFRSTESWQRLKEHWDISKALTAMDGPDHLEERRRLKPFMSRQLAQAEQPEILRIVQDLLGSYTRGAPVTLRELTRTLVNRIIYYLFTGESLKLPADVGDALSEYERYAMNVVSSGRWPRLAFHTPRYRRIERITKSFIHDLIQEYRANPPDSGFFKMVLDGYDSNPNHRENDLFIGFLAPFFAALDSVGSSLGFLLKECIETPSMLQRVREAVDGACRDNNGVLPVPGELRKITALFGLCQETLRRYPAAFAISRSAARDFEIHGYSIEAGESLLIVHSAPHFDPKYFPDPYTFDINRYMEPRVEHKQRFALSPYGRGPHICVGAALADSMMLVLCAALLKDFEFTAAAPGRKYRNIYDPTLSVSRKYAVNVRERHHSRA